MSGCSMTQNKESSSTPGISRNERLQGLCEICYRWQALLELCPRCGSLIGECCLALGMRLCLECFYEDWGQGLRSGGEQ